MKHFEGDIRNGEVPSDPLYCPVGGCLIGVARLRGQEVLMTQVDQFENKNT